MYFLIILQQLIASGTHLFAKSVTHDVPAPVVLFFRAMSVCVLYFIYTMYKRKDLPKFQKEDWKKLLILGLVNIPINQFLFLKSMEYTSAPNVALAYALTPAFVYLMQVYSGKEKMSAYSSVGIFVAVLGTCLILFEKGVNFSSRGFIGDIMALMASFSWAYYTIKGKEFTHKYGALYATGLTMFAGFALYIPIFYFLPVHIDFASISTNNWLQIAYLGLITSGVGYGIWYYALKKIDASKVSVFNNLQPVLTTVFSVLLFHQSISHIFVIGGLLILFGVFITQRA
jgi:drug/metabolite transporter (DMT)-like permease